MLMTTVQLDSGKSGKKENPAKAAKIARDSPVERMSTVRLLISKLAILSPPLSTRRLKKNEIRLTDMTGKRPCIQKQHVFLLKISEGLPSAQGIVGFSIDSTHK